ncbi:MAG TPA: SDR family NAD(P)-dependent oxidoreductase [Acidimicrobiales bacterium]|nr:SDR family NAD(P)-dependent oxidoreductase [Acidimicrobiales bacterium]
MQRFEGRVVIVTGAASGIGRATTERLAAEGATVVAVDRDADGLATTAKAVAHAGTTGDGVTALTGDVGDPATAAEAVALATDRHGRLDVLVNNAGILRFEHSHQVAAEDWDRVLRVNLTGTFQFCQAALPVMVAAGRGSVVNVASTAALFGHAWAAAYAASKGGVLALTRTLAVEYAKQGVRVNAVCPGSIDTPITGAFNVPEGADPNLVRRIMSPVGASGPEPVAAAIAYLASDDASHVNGADIRVDGGTHT